MLGAVRAAAISHGINPDLMERVARSEGLAGSYGGGDRGTSFGAMQLHRGGRGSVGTEFERETGLNLADPKNERAATDYAAGWIQKHGWAAWSGARNQGITGRMGVGVDTSKWAGELGGRKAPHFDVGDIRKSLEGAGGDVMPRIGEHGDVDVRGSANFIRGQFGAPGSNMTRVTTAGGHTMTLNRESAPYLKGFVEELEKGGAPIRSIGGYNYRNITGSNRLSQHAYGNAIDVEQLSRGKTSPAFAQWVQQHREQFDAAERKFHVYGGERFGDFGHFEYGGVPFSKKEAAEIYGSPAAAEGKGLHGAALRDHFGHRAGTHPDLLGSARQSGLVGPPMSHKVEGSAHLKIDVTGPAGVKANMAKMDGMFKTVQLSRGRAMPPASQQS
jgi:hypothetical protein